MKHTLLKFAALPALAATLAAGAFTLITAPARADAPVVVELFTSEGCSSCPPADALLARYAHISPVPGVDVIALGEHVDYWDGGGWRDLFSSHGFSQRQETYASALNARAATPQVVVDGAEAHDGGSEDLDRAAIARAARAPKAQVALTVSGHSLSVYVSHLPASAGRGPVDVLLAVTEDGLSSQVRGGENRGRRLAHGAVVRHLTLLGTVVGGVFQASPTVPVGAGWRRGHLRAVVLVQARSSRRIVGAAQVKLG